MLTLVPPSVTSDTVPRDLIVLLDTSGSMAGEPLDQARKVVLALIDTLTERDQLELVEFSDRARRWNRGPVSAGAEARASARTWLMKLRASGSTEMSDAVTEALAGLRSSAQRQVVLVTDGAIGFETEVIAGVRTRLPAGSRLHTVGVGSAVNRSLTAPAARAGRGVEIVIGPGEDVERVVERLLARTSLPIVVELELEGSALRETAPSRLPDLFAGAPVLIGTRLDPAGGELLVRGRLAGGGRFERRLHVAPLPAVSDSTTPLATLFARERVEDLELELAAGGSAREIDPHIERLGLEFGIATRLTSWVAIDEEISVDPTRPSRRVRQPHELPHATSMLGMGLRAVAPVMGAPLFAGAAAPPAAPSPSGMRSRGGEPFLAKAAPGMFDRVRSWFTGDGRGDDDEFELESEEPSEQVSGKVTLQRGRSLVINVTVTNDAFDWRPGTEAVVVWVSGKAVSARVIAGRTTAAGSVMIGQTVRLWLELEEPPQDGAPRFVDIGEPDRKLRVQLSP
jgi:Ca-activated chloride channel family protein